jgi:pSer/pThr/pTyr-binding forkhead associated (FHA) protein
MSAVIVLILRIAAAAVLCGFTGWAFYLLWKTLGKPVTGKITVNIPALVLTSGKDPEMTVHRFEEGEVLVGRGKHCQLCLEDDTVSARHAQLSYHHNQWWVSDLGSTNGTYLNRLPVSTPTVLAHADTLTFGQVSLVIKLE